MDEFWYVDGGVGKPLHSQWRCQGSYTQKREKYDTKTFVAQELEEAAQMVEADDYDSGQ